MGHRNMESGIKELWNLSGPPIYLFHATGSSSQLFCTSHPCCRCCSCLRPLLWLLRLVLVVATCLVVATMSAGQPRPLTANDIRWRHSAFIGRVLPTCLLESRDGRGELWLGCIDPILDPRWLLEKKVRSVISWILKLGGSLRSFRIPKSSWNPKTVQEGRILFILQ